MGIQKYSVPIVTGEDGTDQSTVNLGEVLVHAIRFEKGTLEDPDITITEEPIGDELVAVADQAADVTWYPSVLDSDAAGADVAGSGRPYPVYDRIQIAIAEGGDTKTGRLILLYER